LEVAGVIWTSPYEQVEVGGTTLPALVAARREDRPALIEGESGPAVSYAALSAGIERPASGLRPGEGLALWAPNSPRWAELALGAMAAGAWVTGLSPLATDRELAAQLGDARPALVATTAALADRALQVPGVRDVIVLDAAAPEGVEPQQVDPDAPALLPYSSGTTGLPKGVVLTHANLVTSVRQLDRHLRLVPDDVVLALAPFSHVMGFVVTCALPLAAGATVVTMARFDLAAMLALIERHRVTVLVVPPPVMGALAVHPAVDRHDLSSLALVVSGGAPLDAARQRAVAARLPGAAVGQGWGMTETCVGATGPDRATGTVPGSAGRVSANCELRVVRDGRDLGPGHDGELWVRGPQLTPGYLRRPEATAALIDAGGWLRTGDLGHVDGGGNVWIVDRLKDLIKVGGYQVAPAELEALLTAHPAVADAAVVAAPDRDRGEIPVAFVVPRGELDPEAVCAWVKERVAPYKRIRELHTVEALPRTPAGKLIRRRLRPAVPA
jgi:acyl-CoA synthetase (AMP-forming)/AMP-acid ligase II